MAHAKNKHSRKIHQSKNRFLSSRAKTPIQKTIFTVIILAVITVFATLICSLVFNPERTTKSTISHLATEYYEDYFYPNVFSGSQDMSEILGRYTDTGLARITLRQLLLYDNQKNTKYQNTLTKYCDENATFVQFFPTEPYGKTNYRTEFTYSCSF